MMVLLRKMVSNSDSASGDNKDKSSSQKVASAVASAKSAADAASAVASAAGTKSTSAATSAAAGAATSAATSAAQRAASSSAAVSAVKDATDAASPVIQAVEHAVDSKNKSVSKIDSAQDSNEENSEVEVLQEDEQDEKNSISASGTTSAAPSSKKMKEGYKVPGEKKSKELYHIEDGLFNKVNSMSEDDLKELNKYVDSVIEQGAKTATQYVKTNVYAKDSNFGWNMAANAATLPKVVMQKSVNRASRKVSEKATKVIEERHYANQIILTIFQVDDDTVVGKIVHDFDSIKNLDLSYEYTGPESGSMPGELQGAVTLIRSPEETGKSACEFTRLYERWLDEGEYWNGVGAAPNPLNPWPFTVLIEFKSAGFVGSTHLMTIEFDAISSVTSDKDVNAEFPGYEQFTIQGLINLKD